MSVKGYLGLLVGVFVAARAVVTVTQRSNGGGWPGLLVPPLVTLYAAKEGGLDRVVAGPPPEPPAGSRSFTPEGQDAARYR